MTAVGERAPAFTLPDTSGEPHALDGSPVTVVVFTCNHCPYALAWHERINAVAREYEGRGVRTLQISSNDATRYPRDSVDAMRDRVAAGELRAPIAAELKGFDASRHFDAKRLALLDPVAQYALVATLKNPQFRANGFAFGGLVQILRGQLSLGWRNISVARALDSARGVPS